MTLPPQPTVALLFSGGLDSSIAVGRLLSQGHRVQPIYVAFGLAWETPELQSAMTFLRAIATPQLNRLQVLEMPAGDLYGDHWSITGVGVPDAHSPDEAVYLPGRNPLLLLKARMWCQLQGIDRLALGCLGNNPFADASEEFFAEFGRMLDRATDSVVHIYRPLANFTKQQIMQLGHALPLEHTFSCIDPRDGLHCGRCNKCAERQQAFRAFEMHDPTEYAGGLTASSTQRVSGG